MKKTKEDTNRLFEKLRKKIFKIIPDILDDVEEIISGIGKDIQEEDLPEKGIPVNKNDRMIPLIRWNDFHTYPTISAMRSLVYRMEPGFEKVVVRMGRRVLIDEEEWFKFVKEKGGATRQPPKRLPCHSIK